MPKVVNYQITVSGRVQGVGFRYSALNMANQLEITGYVKNLYNGQVLLEIEGSKEQTEIMIEWCRIGPGTGHVKEISIVDGSVKNHSSFRVRY